MKPPVERYCIVYEPGNLGRRNFDVSMIREFVDIGNLYPERLDKIYVIKPNMLYRWLVKIAGPFLPKAMMDKLVFVSEFGELEQYFTRDNILKQYGGDLDFKYRFTPTRKLRLEELEKLAPSVPVRGDEKEQEIDEELG